MPNVPPVPEGYDPESDALSDTVTRECEQIYRHLFGTPDTRGANGLIRYRMSQIISANANLESIDDDLRVRIPASGSLIEMREVHLLSEIRSEAEDIAWPRRTLGDGADSMPVGLSAKR